jgi:excisionase family DNA binding protein
MPDRLSGALLAELGEPLLRTSEVAELFQVSQRTVTAWARSGRIESIRMPGGHWRFPRRSVRAVLDSRTEEAR